MMMVAMDVAGVVKNVLSIASAIYECAQQVKVNQSQCRRLTARIRVIVDAIAQLDQLPESNEFQQGIESLV
jgi:hypothetical protein